MRSPPVFPPRRTLSAALLALALLAALGAAPPATAQARADTLAAVHLLQRATFGVRQADVAALLREGRAAWLERQLSPDGIPNDGLAARLAAHPAAGMSVAELYRAFPPAQPARLVAELAGARLQRAVYGERQLEEVMTDFWFNHFNVFAGKAAVRWLVADYERTAIRPHVFGRFEELLRATARHPAMLLYLDNARSVAIDSSAPAYRRRQPRPEGPRRTPGLNENYGRELLELHTLGVDGGYTQQDVIEVARAFTGWTVARPGRDAGAGPGFVFRPELHDRGAKTVLGRALPAGRGEQDGLDVLHLLATHPATARHLARKLVQRFVADEPRPRLEAELVRVFLASDGGLREVTRTLFSAPEFHAAENRGAKLKTPFELVASALRATDAEVGDARGVLQTLRTLGQVPYAASAPTGYPATSEEWTNGGAMLARMNFALALAAGRLPGVRLPPLQAPGATPEARVHALARRVLPAAPTAELERRVLADVANAPGGASDVRALGLLLGSPEFQKK